MSLRYVMKRTWFSCLEIPVPGSEESWHNQQRFMYLRLRRLVGSVNEYLLEKINYERELLMRASDLLPIPKPPEWSSYSGYGEHGGKFFFYGIMNEYDYDAKIMDVWRKESARDRMQKKNPDKKPCFDLVITVDLKCSPELAPLSVRSLLKWDHFENSPGNQIKKQKLYLKLSIICPASISSKLPGKFVWEVHNS